MNEISSFIHESSDEQQKIEISSIERKSLLFSLSIWSLMMHKNSERFFNNKKENHQISLKKIVDLLKGFEDLKVKVLASKSICLNDIDKSFEHILRAANLCLIANLKVNKNVSKTEILEPIEGIFDLLKNQLLSAYHG